MSFEKLENWKTSIEIDYLSLYIKTWFAFLTSIKQIHPNIHSTIGDSLLINHYIDNLSLPNNYDPDIKKYIQESFITGRNIIKRDLPNLFFGKFYSINQNYSFVLSPTTHVRFKLQYKSNLNGKRNPNIFIEFKSTQEQFRHKFRTYLFSFNILVNDIIENDLYTDKESTLSFIIDKMRKHGLQHIESMSNLQESGINQRKAYLETILTLIGQQWRQDFIVNDIFKPLPVPNFPYDYNESSQKIVILKWFVRFSYDLRNILFHHIIDPFDEKWLMLFKSTYHALNEIVNHNINTIKQSQTNDLNPLS